MRQQAEGGKMSYEDYNDWVKKNWLTVIGIIIILAVVWYDVATVQAKIKENVDKCNEYWQGEVERVCPALLGTMGWQGNMLNNTNISWN